MTRPLLSCSRCRRRRYLTAPYRTCARCRRSINAYSKRRYETLCLSMRCVSCKRRSEGVRCPECLRKNRETTRAWREKGRAG